MVHYERYVQLKKGVVAAVVYEDVNENNKLLGSHNNGSTLGLLCGGSGVGGYYNYQYYFNISIKRTRPKLFYLLLLTLLSCTLIVAPQFCFLPSTFPLLCKCCLLFCNRFYVFLLLLSDFYGGFFL